MESNHEKALIVTNPIPLALGADNQETMLAEVRELTLGRFANPHTRDAYARALGDFETFRAGQAFNPTLLASYRAHLINLTEDNEGKAVRRYKPRSVNLHLVGLRAFVYELCATHAEFAPFLPTMLRQLKSESAGRGSAGKWASRSEALNLLAAPAAGDLKGLRDKAVLAVALTTGLRRAEVASLQFEQMQRREVKGEMLWIFAGVMTKKTNLRDIPLLPSTRRAVERWTVAAGIRSGAIFRRIRKGGAVGTTAMTPQAVYQIVKDCSDLAPHDLRRTFAEMLKEDGATLQQIQLALGHARLETTERYLKNSQELEDSGVWRLKLKF